MTFQIKVGLNPMQMFKFGG